MSRYRKKPVVIDAVRWDGTAMKAGPIVGWILRSGATAQYHEHTPFEHEGGYIAIDTLEGTMTAWPGDWIIRGVQGEFYPCKPTIFEATYEPVGESDE